MKPFLLLVALLTHLFVYSQKDPKNKFSKTDSAKLRMQVQPNMQAVNYSINQFPNVIVYEHANFTGRTASITKDAEGKYNFPFPTEHVSIRFPKTKILYIRDCSQEFPSEHAYVGSISDINLKQVCGIRMDEWVAVRVTFNGISTEVHNLDCMRFAGKIEISVFENSTNDQTRISMPSYLLERDGRPSPNALFKRTVFDWGKSQLTDSRYSPYYNNTGTIFNNNPVPEIRTKAHDFFGYSHGGLVCSFFMGRSALESGRAILSVKADLTSSHKTCDLCDDFSSNISMKEPGYASIIFNKDQPYVIAGPFAAHGTRDGQAITATSGTYKNFRVHLEFIKADR